MKYATAALIGVAALSASVTSHSWIEEIRLIDPKTQTFLDPPGYRRNNIGRSDPGFQDKKAERQLPALPTDDVSKRDAMSIPTITTAIPADTLLCKNNNGQSQQKPIQAPKYPRLQASPGDWIAIRYLENGHVTQPQIPARKPKNSGKVYLYMTTKATEGEKFWDVFNKWNQDGTGGDKRGKLLGVFPFDDGRCYEKNDSPISQERQKKYPVQSGLTGAGSNACQMDVQLPAELTPGMLSLYWIWDWSTEASAPGANDGTPELYTSCFDIDIGGQSTTGKQSRSLVERSNMYDNMAIPDQMKSGSPAAAPAPAASSTQPTPASQPATLAQATSPAPPAASAQATSQAPAAASSSAASQATSPACAGPAQPPSVDVKALASAVAEELAKQKKKMVTVTVTQSAAAGSSSSPSAASALTPAAESNSIATAVPSAMSFASPIMAPAAASPNSQAQAPTSAAASQATAAPVPANQQAATASPAPPSQSGAVQAGNQYVKRSCKLCPRRSRIF